MSEQPELRALIEAIINDYHTTRIDSDYVPHILAKPRTQVAFAKFEQSIRAEREAELVAENFRLAAGACINPGQHGLVGDERGNGVCTAFEALNASERENAELVAENARLREALGRILKAPLINHSDRDDNPYAIARQALAQQDTAALKSREADRG